MKNTIILVLLSMLISFGSAGGIVSVVNGDDLQTKINNANAGDVLMIGAGTYSGTIILNKQLTLIGTGYFLPGGGPGVGTSVITGTFEAVSDGSGSMVTGLQFNAQVNITASNAVFSRNYFNSPGSYLYIGYDSNNSSKSVENLILKQNYIKVQYVAFQTNSSTALTNVSFNNNITIADFNLTYGSGSSVKFVNNNFASDLNSSGQYFGMSNPEAANVSYFYNNIFSYGLVTSSSYLLNNTRIPNAFKYNIMVGNGGPESNAPETNLINQSNDGLYLGYPANPSGVSIDAKNILKPGSPAISFGKLPPYDDTAVNTDAGAFGGEEPYVQSGIPTGPYVQKIVVPSVAANNSTIQIQVKAKTNN